LEERSSKKKELQKKLDALRSEMRRLQHSAVGADQMAIDFVNATLNKKLEVEDKQLSKELKSVTDNISYWRDFTDDNNRRVEAYYNDYRQVTTEGFPLNAEALNLSSGYLSQIDETQLRAELR
jgi:hypothetical protein